MPRDTTPGPIKRLLRQEAGFGCCICGIPILQYHHIIKWADEQHFRPEDMMVLCPLHHDQVTKGAMSENEQRQHKCEPVNIRKHRVKGLLELRQNYCAASFGSVIIVSEGPFLQINGESILSLDLGEGNLEVSIRLFSSADEPLLEIVRNEWTSGDPLPWDIEANWQTLTLRERAQKITLSLNGREIPLEVRGELWRGGRFYRIDRDRIHVGGTPSMKMSIANMALVGSGVSIEGEEMKVVPGGGTIISHREPRERLRIAKEAWRRMQRERVQPD
jgi:hypothetical protein